MFCAGTELRFTPAEIEDFRKLGLDFDSTRTPGTLGQVLARWGDTLNQERPDLLEKIAADAAQAKGVKLPERLARVCWHSLASVLCGNRHPSIGRRSDPDRPDRRPQSHPIREDGRSLL